MFARRAGPHLAKADSQHVVGCWLGNDSRTDEHLVATLAGLTRSRAVRRQTEVERWDANCVRGMTWLPWLTTFARRGRPLTADAAREPIEVGTPPGTCPRLGVPRCPLHPLLLQHRLPGRPLQRRQRRRRRRQDFRLHNLLTYQVRPPTWK